jgi:hypothetical protein
MSAVMFWFIFHFILKGKGKSSDDGAKVAVEPAGSTIGLKQTTLAL